MCVAPLRATPFVPAPPTPNTHLHVRCVCLGQAAAAQLRGQVGHQFRHVPCSQAAAPVIAPRTQGGTLGIALQGSIQGGKHAAACKQGTGCAGAGGQGVRVGGVGEALPQARLGLTWPEAPRESRGSRTGVPHRRRLSQGLP